MKKIVLICLVAFTTTTGFSQSNFSVDSFSYKYRIDTIYSDILKEKRVVKIYLPSDFKKENKYPVFYVLDEDWMFEPTVTNVKQLFEANVIPSSIVVGIHSNNRSKDLRLGTDGDFTETSRNFYQFISSELVNYLKKNLTDPAFSILIGHSDGAVFSQKVLTSPNQPFNSIISLSIQLADGQFKEINNYTQQNLPKQIYHFIGGGTKDAPYRLESAIKLDSLFNTVHNLSLKVKVQIYKADHFAIAARALNDGISFTFNDYIQENDLNEPLLDSLRKANTNPVNYIKQSIAKINSTYNIEALPLNEGLISVGSAIVTNKIQLEEFYNYKVKLYGKDHNYNSFYAQNLERLNEYEEALKYWKLNLIEDTASFSGAYFYYRRPIELVAYKMDNAKEAIKLAEEWQIKKPEYLLYFNYTIAKICSDKQIKKNKGKKAINYCLNNYKVNGFFKIDEARLISEKLNK